MRCRAKLAIDTSHSLLRRNYSMLVSRTFPTAAKKLLNSNRYRVGVLARQVAAMATKYEVVVKGDPVNSKLGDCPFCHRVLLTLQTKGIDYDMTYVDFDKKPEWLIQQAGGKVPVLKQADTNLVMPDSDVIVQHLEKNHPQPGMMSGAYMDQHPPTVGAKLFPAFRGYLFSEAGSSDEAEKKAAIDAELKALNDALSQPGVGPLFDGSNMNVLDAAIAPKLYHVEVALKHFKGYEISPELKAVKAYLAAVKQLPAWKATDYGPDMIIAGWKHHLARGH